jgi:Arc/MetJ-type ribon-helix-helix transcriptional regulator
MTTPVPTRFTDDELAMIDRLVSDGAGRNRSDVIRRALAYFDEAERRARLGRRIADSYRIRPQSGGDVEMAMANAVAMSEAEPW